MPALQNGTVVVDNGNAVVRHVWRLVVTAYTPITPNAAVTWPGGSGVFLSYDPVTSHLRLYRTSGPLSTEPAAGTVISGGGGGATVIQYGPGTPGNWHLGTLGPNVSWFHRASSGKAYPVQSLDATDQLTLTVPYQDPDEFDVAYGVTQDYTVNFGIAIVQLGDVDAHVVIGIAMETIDQRLLQLALGQHFQLPTSPGAPGTLWNSGGFVKVS